jgi:hypothetical protein
MCSDPKDTSELARVKASDARHLRSRSNELADRFELEIINSADPCSAAPLTRIKIGGHMLWQGPHPIAPGAQKVDFVADESYAVTPLARRRLPTYSTRFA